MKSGFRATIIVASTFAAVVCVVAVLFPDTNRVWSAVVRVDWSVWCLILFLSIFNYALRFLRWHFGLLRISTAQVPLLKHLMIYIAGFAFTATPGKAGEASRSLFLKKYGFRYEESLAAFFCERLFDLASIIVLALFVLAVFPQYASIIWAAAGFIALICAACYFGLLDGILRRMEGHQHWNALYLTFKNTSLLLSWRAICLGVPIGVLAWGAEGLGLYIVVRAMVPDASVLGCVGAYAVAMLLGAVSFLPGGLGGAEAAMVVALHALGVSLADAMAATLICRLVTLWLAIFLGGLALTALGLRK